MLSGSTNIYGWQAVCAKGETKRCKFAAVLFIPLMCKGLSSTACVTGSFQNSDWRRLETVFPPKESIIPEFRLAQTGDCISAEGKQG